MDFDKYRAKKEPNAGGVVSVRVSLKTIDMLKVFAAANGLSFSEGVRCILDVYTTNYIERSPDKAILRLKSELNDLENMLKRG
jgi:hypothetical protein